MIDGSKHSFEDNIALTKKSWNMHCAQVKALLWKVSWEKTGGDEGRCQCRNFEDASYKSR